MFKKDRPDESVLRFSITPETKVGSGRASVRLFGFRMLILRVQRAPQDVVILASSQPRNQHHSRAPGVPNSYLIAIATQVCHSSTPQFRPSIRD